MNKEVFKILPPQPSTKETLTVVPPPEPQIENIISGNQE